MPSPNSPADPETRFAAQRARYREGLLAWLKTPADPDGLDRMRQALTAIRTDGEAACRILCEAALAFLADIAAPPSDAQRHLAMRIEPGLKRAFVQRSLAPDDPLLRDLGNRRADRAEHRPGREVASTVGEESGLAQAFAATASILPLLGQPREPRFKPEQRKTWDAAVTELVRAWKGFSPVSGNAASSSLRQAVLHLLEGSLALAHPAPLRLAEALASALDDAETEGMPPRRQTAFAASVELLAETDFLEHEALVERVEQLARRLASRDLGPRSRTVNTLFAAEANEETEEMKSALEAIPPDLVQLTDAARRLSQLAESLELSALALAAFRFGETVARLEAAQLDHPPARDDALGWIAAMERWIAAIGTNARPELPQALSRHLQALQKEIRPKKQDAGTTSDLA